MLETNPPVRHAFLRFLFFIRIGKYGEWKGTSLTIRGGRDHEELGFEFKSSIEQHKTISFDTAFSATGLTYIIFAGQTLKITSNFCISNCPEVNGIWLNG